MPRKYTVKTISTSQLKTLNELEVSSNSKLLLQVSSHKLCISYTISEVFHWLYSQFLPRNAATLAWS